jgi:hypothetical protein
MHPCHTDDPLKADVFVVPAQTVSAIWLSREPGPNGEPPVKDEGSSYMKQGGFHLFLGARCSAEARQVT